MRYKIYARGKTVDYRWSAAPDFNFHDYLGGNGIIVARTNTGTYTVYLVSEPSAITDFLKRPTRIGVLANECSEQKAKGVAVWALKHWDGFCEEFERFVKDFGSDEWEADDTALEKFFAGIPEINTTGATLERRSENGNTPENRKNLAEEMEKFDFSQTAGFKLTVDGELMTGGKLKKLHNEAQRYLSGDGGKRYLADDAQKQKSETQDMPNISQFIKQLKKYLPVLILIVFGFMTWNENTVNKKHIEELQDKLRILSEKDGIDYGERIHQFNSLQNEINANKNSISNLNQFARDNKDLKNHLEKKLSECLISIGNVTTRIAELENENCNTTNRLTNIELHLNK